MRRREFLTASSLLPYVSLFPQVAPATSVSSQGPPISDVVIEPDIDARLFWTTQRQSHALENIEQLAPFRQLRQSMNARARQLLQLPSQHFVDLIQGQEIPRSAAVNRDSGSPHGKFLTFRSGNYPWLGSFVSNPWKIQDPITKELYPSNDFYRYLKSGFDKNGVFSRAKADASILINSAYPDHSDSWGVDDGSGWIDATNVKWLFIAYYNHWHVWYGGRSLIMGALPDLIFIHQLARTPALFRLITFILVKVAKVYPTLDISAYPRSAGFVHSDGHSGKGLAVGRIWEADLSRSLLLSYEGMLDSWTNPTTEERNALSDTTLHTHSGDRIHDTTDIAHYVGRRLLSSIYHALYEKRILGNFGTHHAAALTVAQLTSDSSIRQGLIKDVMHGPSTVQSSDKPFVPVFDVLNTAISIDGFGAEGAPGYNQIWTRALLDIASILSTVNEKAHQDLVTHPKFRAAIIAQARLHVDYRLTPAFGDSGQFARPILVVRLADLIKGMQYIESTEGRNLAIKIAKNKTNEWKGLMLENPGTISRSLNATSPQPETLPSRFFPHLGFALLRLKTAESPVTATLQFGRGGHGHKDCLSVGLYADGMDILPDLGYPEFADGNRRDKLWSRGTLAHNVPVLDWKEQNAEVLKQQTLFAEWPDVSMISVCATDLGEASSRVRRTLVLAGREHSNSWYLTDITEFSGGTECAISWHAQSESVNCVLDDDERTYVAKPSGEHLCDEITGSEACEYLWAGQSISVKTNEIKLTWPLRRYWTEADPSPDTGGGHKENRRGGATESRPARQLEIVTQGELRRLVFATGAPPRNKKGNPECIPFAFVESRSRQMGSEHVSTQFSCLQMRGVNAPTERVIMRAPSGKCDGGMCAREMAHQDGVLDLVLSSNTAAGKFRSDLFDFEGRFAHIRLHPGGKWRAYIIGGKILRAGATNYGMPGATVLLTEQVIQNDDGQILQCRVMNHEPIPKGADNALISVTDRKEVSWVIPANIIRHSEAESSIDLLFSGLAIAKSENSEWAKSGGWLVERGSVLELSSPIAIEGSLLKPRTTIQAARTDISGIRDQPQIDMTLMSASIRRRRFRRIFE